MDAGDVIAVYAAVVGTASVGWQVYIWRHQRRSHVVVDGRIGITGAPGGAIEIITIEARNLSEHAVRVSGAGVDLQDGSGNSIHLVHAPAGATLPGAVEPHDSGQTWLEHDEAKRAGIDVCDPVTVWVRLATGETIKSKPHPLMRRS